MKFLSKILAYLKTKFYVYSRIKVQVFKNNLAKLDTYICKYFKIC